MSNPKLLLFFGVALAVVIAVQSQARDMCNRPKTFENIKHIQEYVACIKSQASIRYGKRAQPLLLGRLRPDLYNDYENNLSPLYDVLFAEN